MPWRTKIHDSLDVYFYTEKSLPLCSMEPPKGNYKTFFLFVHLEQKVHCIQQQLNKHDEGVP